MQQYFMAVWHCSCMGDGIISRCFARAGSGLPLGYRRATISQVLDDGYLSQADLPEGGLGLSEASCHHCISSSTWCGSSSRADTATFLKELVSRNFAVSRGWVRLFIPVLLRQLSSYPRRLTVSGSVESVPPLSKAGCVDLVLVPARLRAQVLDG